MADNIINLAERKKTTAEKKEAYMAEALENKERIEKVHERIKELPQYRGEVITKNNIRNLKEVSKGEIFWVSSENKAYVVSDKDKKKIELKALDETATISTGLTIYDMNKAIVSKEPTLDLSKGTVMNKLIDGLMDWFGKRLATYYLAYGRDVHYVTMFKNSASNSFNEASAQLVVDTIAAVGDIISIDYEEDRIEVWIRTKDSKAELIYIMPYDDGLVRLTR